MSAEEIFALSFNFKKKYEGSIKIIYIIFMLTLFINLLKRKVTQTHII
jgi:hypothetical protein